jgi:site-specific DNA recombinase
MQGPRSVAISRCGGQDQHRGDGMRRVAAYCRVSTGRQADADLSLPDQQRQIRQYCERHGWALVRLYTEPGASARDDDRPEFRAMIEDATSAARPFDVIVVHSLSRFFRDEALGELYVRRLRRHKVELQSVTQHIGSDPLSDLARRVVGLLDEHTSKETAKHTLRSMEENARQGYWNGSRPPLGYRVVAAGQKGQRIKKRLAVDVAEAELARRIFRLYAEGEDGTGPLGTKKLALHLNAAGIRTRVGKPFTPKLVHEILTRETYIGRHYFNTVDSRAKEAKPRDQWIEVAVEPIIDVETFAAVQSRLRELNPKQTPGRVSGSPHLLTGILRCGYCGGAMTMGAGKSGRYKYYRCCTKGRLGPSACVGQSIPMLPTDEAIVRRFRECILDPAVLEGLVEGLRSRIEVDRRKSGAATAARLLAEAEAAVDRLFQLVATGAIAADNLDLKRHLETMIASRDQARSAHTEASSRTERALPQPSLARYRALADGLKEVLQGAAVPARKRAIRTIVDRIEMKGRELRFVGNARKLALLAEKADESRVIGFMAGWRPQRDLNPCSQRERLMS